MKEDKYLSEKSEFSLIIENQGEETDLSSLQPLPDLSKDEKEWQALQNILQPADTDVEIEHDFFCPITSLIMLDPVDTIDKQTYEREAIEEWFRTGKNTSPTSNEELADLKLESNLFAKKTIRGFLDKNSILKDSTQLYMSKNAIAELKHVCESADEKAIIQLAREDRRLLVLPINTGDNKLNQTILHFAAGENIKAVDIILHLLESRQTGLALAALLQTDINGRLPFHQAMIKGQNAQTLIKLMALMGNQIVKIQPPAGGWPCYFTDWRPINEAMIWCVHHEDVNKALCLVGLGANLHIKMTNGETLVYQAVKENLPAV